MRKTSILKTLYQVRNWKSHYRALVHGTVTFIEKAAISPVETVKGSAVIRRNMAYKTSLGIVVNRAEQNRPKGWFKRLFWMQTLDLGVVSRRVVTTAGVRFLVDDFNAGGTEISNMKFHAMGTGAVAEAAADTLLGAEVETRTSGSQASATAGVNATYTTVALITATAVRAITEHGLFNVITTATITLWDRSVFSVINLGIGDSITFTYVLTANSGG